MRNQQIEIGYLVDLPNARVKPVQFVRDHGKSAVGINPETGRISWIHGAWIIGKSIYLTPEEAIAAGEAAKDKRIASLRKQLARLEAATFKLED